MIKWVKQCFNLCPSKDAELINLKKNLMCIKNPGEKSTNVLQQNEEAKRKESAEQSGKK